MHCLNQGQQVEPLPEFRQARITVLDADRLRSDTVILAPQHLQSLALRRPVTRMVV